jgi:hypothetical protein
MFTVRSITKGKLFADHIYCVDVFLIRTITSYAWQFNEEMIIRCETDFVSTGESMLVRLQESA